jgi:hypothetical protein
MDWITTIWNKINKPLHFLFVGAALVWFAPAGTNWTGYIFIATGVAGSVEWVASQIKKWLEKKQIVNSLRQSIVLLNGDEVPVLQAQVQKGEQTFYLIITALMLGLMLRMSIADWPAYTLVLKTKAFWP